MFNEYNLFVQSYQLAEKVLVSLYNSFYDMHRLNREWAVVMVCDHSRRPIHNVFIWNDKGKTGRDEDPALDYRWCNCILDVASLLFYFKLVDIIITPNKSCQICSSTIFRIVWKSVVENVGGNDETHWCGYITSYNL